MANRLILQLLYGMDAGSIPAASTNYQRQVTPSQDLFIDYQ
jgi:hypothetical protein